MEEQENTSREEYKKQTERAQKLIDILYPDISKLSPADRMKVIRNESFIHAHTDMVETWYNELLARSDGKVASSETMAYVVKSAKEKYYSETLHPEINQTGTKLSYEQFAQFDRDEQFLTRHMDEFEESLDEVRRTMNSIGQELPEQELIKLAMDRTRNLKITPNQISKRTFDVSKLAKDSAKNMENITKTKDENDRGDL